MAFEVVPTAAGRLHSDQYTKIIIINTPINLRVFPCSNELDVLADLYSCIRDQRLPSCQIVLFARVLVAPSKRSEALAACERPRDYPVVGRESRAAGANLFASISCS